MPRSVDVSHVTFSEKCSNNVFYFRTIVLLVNTTFLCHRGEIGCFQASGVGVVALLQRSTVDACGVDGVWQAASLKFVFIDSIASLKISQG